MTGHKRKAVVLVVAVALGSGLLAVCSSQSRTIGSVKGASEPGTGSFFANDPNLFANVSGSPSTTELFSKMILSVLLVVVLGAAAVYVSKKFLPRITNLPGKKIRIAETAHLGPRKAVHLIEIGRQRLLIGSTNESITMLADVTAAGETGQERLKAAEALNEMDLAEQETSAFLRT